MLDQDSRDVLQDKLLHKNISNPVMQAGNFKTKRKKRA